MPLRRPAQPELLPLPRHERKFAPTGKAKKVPLELPPIEDHFSVQVAIGRILSALATGAIDQRNAGLFLYGIQIAASNLPRETGVLTPSGSVRRVVLTRQNEQIAIAETVFEEEETTKGHKRNCDCDKCVSTTKPTTLTTPIAAAANATTSPKKLGITRKSPHPRRAKQLPNPSRKNPPRSPSRPKPTNAYKPAAILSSTK